MAHTVVATSNYCGCTGDNADSGIYSEGVVSLVCDKITCSRIICVTGVHRANVLSRAGRAGKE